MFALAERAGCLGAADGVRRLDDAGRRRPHRRHDRGLLRARSTRPRARARRRRRTACRSMHERVNEMAIAFRRRAAGGDDGAAAGRLRQDDGDPGAAGTRRVDRPDGAHTYMGPVPAFFYAAGQLMDYGVHSWDIRQGTGRGARPVRRRRRPAGAVHVRDLAGDRPQTTRSIEPCRRSASGSAGATPATTGSRSARRASTYEPGDIEDLPARIEFDAGSLVLTAFGRGNFGTVRGDFADGRALPEPVLPHLSGGGSSRRPRVAGRRSGPGVVLAGGVAGRQPVLGDPRGRRARQRVQLPARTAAP